MIYFKYLLLMFIGWICSVSIGSIFGALLGKIVGKIIGIIFPISYKNVMSFIGGMANPFISIYIISKFLLDKNSDGLYDIIPISLILLPYVLINLQALYNSGVQDGSGIKTYGKTEIVMKVDKTLVFGGLLGCVLSLYYYTHYTF